MSKEITDKINSNLTMLVESLEVAKRDYGYDLRSEKDYIKEIIGLVENLPLAALTQQRKQLIDFSECVVKDVTKKGHAEVVDYFLSKHKSI